MNNDKKLTQLLSQVSGKQIKVKPHKEAVYITVIYLIFGVLWIFFSDSIVNALVKDVKLVQKIQLIKGWLYVFITAGFIYLIMLYRMRLLESATNEIHDGYSNLTAMTEELIEKEDEIYELSHYDPMTGLLNWLGLSIAFEHLTQEKKYKKMALMYIDVDNIKHINETLGHENGNMLLKRIALKLDELCHKNSILSRVSGDEFVIVVPLETEDKLEELAKEVIKTVRTEWHYDHYEFLVTGSLGIALYPEHGEDFDQLMKHADLAMFIAKDNGKNQYSIYHDTIGMETKNYVEVVSQIRHGIEKEEFVLYYQPIIDLSNGKLIAVEALIRWQHPTRGFLTPYHFIDIAEKSGQISKIGKWVFEKACGQLKNWQENDIELKMSINLSGKRLFDENLIEDMKKTLKENDLKKGSIQIEITETAVMKNIHLAIELLHKIRDLDIQIALDDFGTGYSSLTYLQIFPIDVLKIDKEFISNISIAGMEKENNIINAIINLAHSMNLKIVAEGIETYDQAEYLLINDCDYGQGYYYDRPMPAEEIENKYFVKHK